MFKLAIAALLLSCSNAFATYTITISQAGGNVVANGSGSLNLAGLSLFATSSFVAAVDSSFGYLGIGATATSDVYQTAVGPVDFGTGATFYADASSGDLVGVISAGGNNKLLFVPTGYVSGTPLTSSETWNGTTIAAMGLIPGSYIWKWGVPGVDEDSVTLRIIAAPAAQPAAGIPTLSGPALVVMSSLLAVWGFARTRRRRR